MAPKERRVENMGSVEAHGTGWRVVFKMDKKRHYGPLRVTEEATEADRTWLRTAVSREHLLIMLKELSAGHGPGIEEPPAPTRTSNVAARTSSAQAVLVPSSDAGQGGVGALEKAGASNESHGAAAPVAPSASAGESAALARGATEDASSAPVDGDYFETQDDAWCGMHALNNYMGGPYVTKDACRRAVISVRQALSEMGLGDAED